MCNKRKNSLKMLPSFIAVSLLIISGGLKISGYHPMRLHFVELGVDDYLSVLGATEIIFGLLFLHPLTTRLGLLLLTAYFGGAIAMEIPYSMVAGPAVPLVLIWVAAFVRQRSLFVGERKEKEQLLLNSGELARS
jgi:hypothetical protein